MIEQELADIEARALATPAGKWRVGTSEIGDLLVYLPDTAPLYIGDMAETEAADHDLADFLAGARADVLALVAEVRRLRALLT